MKYSNYSPKLNYCLVFLFLVHCINQLLNPGKLNHADIPLPEKNIYKFIILLIPGCYRTDLIRFSMPFCLLQIYFLNQIKKMF